ncbi:DUF883 family protein [Sneathiella limimaris]|uniref:DUF883 family protein n=1 Tax=Sneathiella limimaris TaxID=1964213 RepID=UPI001469E7A4|nr:DUF883 family protein [Sneathiella limimaris]
MNKSNGLNPEMDELKEDLASLRKHVSDMMDAMKTNGAESAREKLDSFKSYGRKGIDQIEGQVKEHPGSSIAIAFAVGFLASLLLRRRS